MTSAVTRWHLLALFVLFLLSVLPVGVSSRPDVVVAQWLRIGEEASFPVVLGDDPFTLTQGDPVVSLNYGHEVAGYPFLAVSNVSGAVQVEARYSEQYAGLDNDNADGPYTFASALSNSFRVEAFNFSGPGNITSSLLQGGLRWQTLRLISGDSVTFSLAGLEPSIDDVDVTRLPGTFSASNPLYSDIWGLGARSAVTACLDAGSQKAIWEVSDDGAYIRGMRPGYSVANSFSSYTLEFDAKVARGGVGWSVGYELGGFVGAIWLNLNGNYPPESTFVNVNKTLMPPSSVVVGYPYGFVNQSTLTTYYVGSYPAPFEIEEGSWYHITTEANGTSLRIFINGTQVLETSTVVWGLTSVVGLPPDTDGPFGFGGWQDQAAYVRNVVATSANGTTLYSNPMTNASEVLAEYGVQANYASVCVDGGKRDRLVWLGDFYHTSRIIGVANGRGDWVRGTLGHALDFQLPNGQLPHASPIGYPPPADPTDFAISFGFVFYPLADYHILGLSALVAYVQFTADLAFVSSRWAEWKLAVTWLLDQRNTTTGLVDFSLQEAELGPAASGTAYNCAAVQALNGMADIAAALNDSTSALAWTGAARLLNTSINSLLWSPASSSAAETSFGYYKAALSNTSISVAPNAIAVLSGVASPSRAASALSAVECALLTPRGYKDYDVLEPSTNINPFTNGFLLAALLRQHRASAASALLETLWGAMLADNETSTGASWEYVAQDGTPGLGLFTSMAAAWGGAATYALTQGVAGIRPVAFGYKTWVVEPAWRGFGLASVNASVPTPFGTLGVEWSVRNGTARGTVLEAVVSAPAGTRGTFVVNPRWASGYDGGGEEVVEIDASRGAVVKAMEFDIVYS